MVEPIDKLREKCRRFGAEEKMVLARFYRKFSIYLTKLLLYTRITANQVTVLGTIVGVIAGILLLFGASMLSISGSLLLQFACLLDFVDGEIARYRKETGVNGIFLDLLSHRIVSPFVTFCLAIGLYNVFHDTNVFFFGFLALLSEQLFVFVRQSNFVTLGLAGQQHIRRARAHSFFLKSLTARKIIRAAHFPFSDFGKPCSILVASLLDAIVPWSSIWTLDINLTYVYLAAFGMFSHVFWVGLAYLVVKGK